MDNITENNKLMAEFIGYKLMPCNNGLAWNSPYQKAIDDKFNIHGKLFHPKGSDYANSYLKFDSDWNWLMEVVDKIESMDFVLNIRQGHVSIVNNSGKTPFYTGSDIVEESKIESVYNTCVEFIKWYNKCG
jgi:hypothetical protein